MHRRDDFDIDFHSESDDEECGCHEEEKNKRCRCDRGCSPRRISKIYPPYTMITADKITTKRVISNTGVFGNGGVTSAGPVVTTQVEMVGTASTKVLPSPDTAPGTSFTFPPNNGSISVDSILMNRGGTGVTEWVPLTEEILVDLLARVRSGKHKVGAKQ